MIEKAETENKRKKGGRKKEKRKKRIIMMRGGCKVYLMYFSTIFYFASTPFRVRSRIEKAET